MANSNNLIPINRRTKSEAREISRKGGIASGEVRRERKKLKEELEILMATGNIQEQICLALISRAMNGDTKAFQIIRDTMDEKPALHIKTPIINPDDIKKIIMEARNVTFKPIERL